MTRPCGRRPMPTARPLALALALWLAQAVHGAAAQGEPAADLPAANEAAVVRAPVAGSGVWTVNVQLWGYVTRSGVSSGSVVNPRNTVALLPRLASTADLRLDLKYATDLLDVVARPRLVSQRKRGGVPPATRNDSYFTQAYLRARPTGGITVTAGRELFSWGPANFRSPSSPFYFDAGRTNPLREVSGVDLARVTAVEGDYVTTLAHVMRSGYGVAGDPYRNTTVLRLDRRTESALLGLVVAPQRRGSTFLGGYGQVTIGEAWLLYAEFGAQRLASQLLPSADLSAVPYALRKPSDRATVSLLGASYTLDSGQTMAVELLRDQHGWRRWQERAYFDRAALLGASPLLGLALSEAPRLLARDYLYLQVQSNPNSAGAFWRVSWTGNLDDRSGQLSLYGEYNLADRWALFGQLALNHGTLRSEFRSLQSSTLNLGAKLFLY